MPRRWLFWRVADLAWHTKPGFESCPAGPFLPGQNQRGADSLHVGLLRPDNLFTNLLVLKYHEHDVAVADIAAPPWVAPVGPTNIPVTVTNAGDHTETFAVILTDLTDGTLIGSNLVASLPSSGARVEMFAWDATAASLGSHTLRAEAGPVAGTTNLTNNIRQVLVNVASSLARASRTR
jgi:hypothetical protein